MFAEVFTKTKFSLFYRSQCAQALPYNRDFEEMYKQ